MQRRHPGVCACGAIAVLCHDYVPAALLRMQAIMQEFKELKKGTPAYGAVLLNSAMDKVLLVQFVGKNADAAGGGGGAWSFPRGKLESKDRGDVFECAVREARSC